MSHQRILCSVLEHNSGENLKMTEGCISAGENQCAERGLSNSPMRVFSYAPVFIIGGNQRIVVKCWFSCKRNTVSFVFLKSICTRKFGVCVCTFLFYVILQLMSVGTKFGGGEGKKVFWSNVLWVRSGQSCSYRKARDGDSIFKDLLKRVWLGIN